MLINQNEVKKNSLLSLFLILLLLYGCKNKIDHYNINEYYINCEENLFYSLYKNFRNNNYIDVIIKKGNQKSNAIMRIRGDSSRDFEKKSLKVKIKDSTAIDSKKVFNFNAEFTDPTFLRSHISSSIFKKMNYPCFSTSFSNIYLNNKFCGLYLEVENIDKNFLIKNQLNKNGDLYKATVDGACLYEINEVKLKWEKKTNKKSSSKSLIKLIEDLQSIQDDNFLDFINKNFNYSKLIDFLAINAFIANGSTYYHNYYLYRDFNNGGKWILLPWDLDKTLSYYNWKPYKYHRTSSDWENDNTLIEKCLQNKQIFADFLDKIHEIGTIINNEFYEPIYDNAIKSLEPFILMDSTNKINSFNNWEKAIKSDKEFLYKRAKKLVQDILSTPEGFNTHKTPDEISIPFKISWDKSKNSEEYEIWVSQNFLYPDSSTLKFKTKNNFYWIDTLPLGNYYWKVIAKNDFSYNVGFNSKNKFNLKKGTALVKTINKNTTLTKKNSPYRINGKLSITDSANIIIEKGVTILMGEDSEIHCKSNFTANGTKTNPITIIPIEADKSFHSINFYNCDISLNNLEIRDGLINCKNSNFKIENSNITVKNRKMEFGEKRPSIIWAWYGKVIIDNVCITGNSKGEGININYSDSEITNSEFYNTPDAIELINVNNGKITNNIVMYSPDDAIDLNDCYNIDVSNNYLINNLDKGISIGTDWGNKFVSLKPGFNGKSSNINVLNNYIVGNNIGICIKDSSVVSTSKNIISYNKTGIKVYRKNKNYNQGGSIKSQQDEISKNINNIEFDKYSKKTFNNIKNTSSVIKFRDNFIFTSLIEFSTTEKSIFLANKSEINLQLKGLTIVDNKNETLFVFNDSHNIEPNGKICITNSNLFLITNYFYDKNLKNSNLDKIYLKDKTNKLFQLKNEKAFK